MAYSVTVSIEDAKLAALSAAVNPRLKSVVRLAAFRVERQAKLNPTYLDTGATRASIHVAIAGGDGDYGEKAAEARNLRPDVTLIPEQVPEGTAGLAASIGPSTSYAAELEFGRHNLPARPFMLPALEAERGAFIAAVKEIISRG